MLTTHAGMLAASRTWRQAYFTNKKSDAVMLLVYELRRSCTLTVILALTTTIIEIFEALATGDDEDGGLVDATGDVDGSNVDVTGNVDGRNVDVTGNVDGSNVDATGNVDG